MQTSSEEITVTVSETAADVLERPLEELPHLSDAIDPDALRTVVSSGANAPSPSVTVTFEYAGLEIVVAGDNMVYAQPIR